VKLTMTATRALICAPGTHSSSSHPFGSTTPFDTRVEGTSVSRLRAMKVAQDQTIDQAVSQAVGPAARGRPL